MKYLTFAFLLFVAPAFADEVVKIFGPPTGTDAQRNPASLSVFPLLTAKLAAKKSLP